MTTVGVSDLAGISEHTPAAPGTPSVKGRTGRDGTALTPETTGAAAFFEARDAANAQFVEMGRTRSGIVEGNGPADADAEIAGEGPEIVAATTPIAV
jgi:hypothetical protein